MKKVVTAGGLNRFIEKACKYPWGIISAWVDDDVYDALQGYAGSHKQYNREKTAELVSQIQQMGFRYETLVGLYKYSDGSIGKEKSFLVWDYANETDIGDYIHKLAMDYNQFAYVYGEPNEEGEFVDRAGNLLSKVIFGEAKKLGETYVEYENTKISFNKVLKDYGTMLKGGNTFRVSACEHSPEDEQYFKTLPGPRYGALRAMGFYQAREQARKEFLEQN